jgi:hypothetical protein
VPLAQFPNAPLLASFAGWGLASASHGDLHSAGRAISTLGLGVWAWQEATEGVNLFRRCLGVGALGWLVVSLAGELK